MTTFIVIYRTPQGANRQALVTACTPCGAIRNVLNIYDAETAWVLGPA